MGIAPLLLEDFVTDSLSISSTLFADSAARWVSLGLATKSITFEVISSLTGFETSGSGESIERVFEYSFFKILNWGLSWSLVS
jgi:hypothetical protein